MKKEQTKLNFFEIPIAEYLLNIGEPLESISNNFYQHKEHDSLKINVSKNYFVWNSRAGEENSKGGVIQYLMIMYGLTKHQAMLKVTNDLKGTTLNPIPKPKYLDRFEYNDKDDRISLELRKFLVAKRKLSNRVVNLFLSKKLIAENEHNEIVFKWIKENEVVGKSKQGTKKLTDEEQERYKTKREYFKYIAPNTEENTLWGFNFLEGEPQNLIFVESGIDLMSYYMIFEKELSEKGNFMLISLDGLNQKKVANFLSYSMKKTELKSIVIATDNDKAGNDFYDFFEKREIKTDKGTIPFERKKPIEKDWNDEINKKEN